MAYRFVENLSIADVAFEAESDSVNELFSDSAKALANTMVKNAGEIKPDITRRFMLNSKDIELLLVKFLERLVFYKDTEQLVFYRVDVDVKEVAGGWTAHCTAHGEKLNPKTHMLVVDVKAATMHMLKVQRKGNKWTAMVVLDI